MTVNRDLADLAQSLQSGIDIAEGGTGSTTAGAARTALGTAASGANTDITGLTLAAGSAGSPSLSKSGDTNTGLSFFGAADTMSVVTGGVEQFRFGSNPVSPGSKNLLINGDMLVSQRGDLTGVGGSNAYVSADMWELRRAAGTEQARVSTSVETLAKANSILVGGHRYALKIDCTTAESAVGADEVMIVCQQIEAQNLQHLLYGSEGSEKPLSLRFGFSSPKSGTHCIALYCPDGNRSLVREFTVASADTFELIKIDNIPGDALGTMNNDNGSGMRVAITLFAGSNYQDTNNTWEASEAAATSNQQNLLDNTANNIFITGVQLEVGSVSTDFEFEPQGVTLAKCKRYFERMSYATNGVVGIGAAGSTTVFYFPIYWDVEKRITPTVTLDGQVYSALGGSGNSSGEVIAEVSVNKCRIAATISSGLNAKEAILVTATGAMTIDATAEL